MESQARFDDPNSKESNDAVVILKGLNQDMHAEIHVNEVTFMGSLDYWYEVSKNYKQVLVMGEIFVLNSIMRRQMAKYVREQMIAESTGK